MKGSGTPSLPGRETGALRLSVYSDQQGREEAKGSQVLGYRWYLACAELGAGPGNDSLCPGHVGYPLPIMLTESSQDSHTASVKSKSAAVLKRQEVRG